MLWSGADPGFQQQGPGGVSVTTEWGEIVAFLFYCYKTPSPGICTESKTPKTIDKGLVRKSPGRPIICQTTGTVMTVNIFYFFYIWATQRSCAPCAAPGSATGGQ